MVRTGRTFRLFLSSTFNDLAEERNPLHQSVFPAVRRLAMAYGARFHVIDLRWGVTDDAAFDQNKVKICLEEIRRCQSSTLKPNFLILLRDRYGWRPLPDDIPAETFHSLETLYSEDPSRVEALKSWYTPDENARPAVFCLKARTGESRAVEAWREIERTLLAILGAARVALPSDRHLLSCGLSATEMEIHLGALDVADSRDHVSCFARKIQGTPPDLQNNPYFDYAPTGRLDSGAQERLSRLKEELSRRLGEKNYCPFSVRWAGDRPSTDHLAAGDGPPGEFNLCRQVRKLSKTLSGASWTRWKNRIPWNARFRSMRALPTRGPRASRPGRTFDPHRKPPGRTKRKSADSLGPAGFRKIGVAQPAEH